MTVSFIWYFPGKYEIINIVDNISLTFGSHKLGTSIAQGPIIETADTAVATLLITINTSHLELRA